MMFYGLSKFYEQSKVYEPREDSFLLKKQIPRFIKKTDVVLDMGTGSGIQAIEAAKHCKKVIAVDIMPEAISVARTNAEKEGLKNIEFVQSNLFRAIKQNQKFDLIIFNPPYLPVSKNQELEQRHSALDGGKTGVELIAMFLKQAKSYLKKDGKILMIYSSLTQGFEDAAKKQGYSTKVLEEQGFFMERIYAVVLTKNPLT